MSAKIDAYGVLRHLGGKAGAATSFAKSDVEDAQKLSDALTAMAADVATVANRHEPTFIDYEDQAVDGAGGELVLTHGFGGRVRWYVVDWTSTLGGVPPVLEKSSRTTADILVLTSNEAGVATIRVEKA